MTTVQHTHLIDAVVTYLSAHGVRATAVPGGDRAPLRGQILGCSYAAARGCGAREVLFIGTGVFHPLGVRLATGLEVVALDPFTGVCTRVDASRLLRQRFAIIERARGAASFGILVSEKTGQRREALVKYLMSLTDLAVPVRVNEVTPDLLLNLGFSAYVNTACPRLAYDDQVRFSAPVLSPPEFEILCGVRKWEDYAIDEIT